MTLDDYLSLPDSPTAAEFGARCSPPISEASISRIRKGRQNLSRDTMLSIIEASGGMVTADGLLGLHIQPDTPADHSASATNADENIRAGAAEAA